MAHESFESYYLNNFNVMFHKDIGYVNNFSLSDLESIYPYERDIYMILMQQKIEEYNKKSSSGSSGASL